VIHSKPMRFVPVNYDELPKYKPYSKSRWDKFVIDPFLNYGLIIPPIVMLIKMGCAKNVFPNISNKSKLSEKANKDLTVLDHKIEDIAEKIGLTRKKIKGLHIMVKKKLSLISIKLWNIPGQEVIFLSPLYLLNPVDLPDDLKLDSLKKNEDFDKWLLRFEKWMYEEYLDNENVKYKSQFQYDSMKERVKAWVKLAKENQLEDVKEFLLGHELSHLKHKHTLQQLVLELACHIISGAIGVAVAAAMCLLIPALPHVILAILVGTVVTLTLLFITSKMLLVFSRFQEKQADMTCAKKTGKASGGIRSFHFCQKWNVNLLTRYYEISESFTSDGDNKDDHKHPSLSDRIRYLTKFTAPICRTSDLNRPMKIGVEK